MTTDPGPQCRVCNNAPVRHEVREAPRRLGESSGEQHEVRVCTDPACRSHDPKLRRLGDAP